MKWKSLSPVWLCNPMDCSLPGSSVHGVSQATILEWVAISSSRESSRPRDQTHISCVSCISRWILYHWITREAPLILVGATVHLKFNQYTHSPSVWVSTALVPDQVVGNDGYYKIYFANLLVEKWRSMLFGFECLELPWLSIFPQLAICLSFSVAFLFLCI